MYVGEAILKTFYTALNGNVSVPVYSGVLPEAPAYVYLSFDLGGNEGTKQNKGFIKRQAVEIHVTADNYAAGRANAFNVADEVEQIIWPSPQAVLDMTDYGYQMNAINLVDTTTDDVLYTTSRIIRIILIFEIQIETI
jgi:hypothetical protein